MARVVERARNTELTNKEIEKWAEAAVFVGLSVPSRRASNQHGPLILKAAKRYAALLAGTKGKFYEDEGRWRRTRKAGIELLAAAQRIGGEYPEFPPEKAVASMVRAKMRLVFELRRLREAKPALWLESDSVWVPVGPFTLEYEDKDADGTCLLDVPVLSVRMPWKGIQQADPSTFRVETTDASKSARSNPGVIHPHVKDGVACWGTAGPMLATALRRLDLRMVVRLIEAAMGHYNPGSPYVALSAWNEVRCNNCGISVEATETCTTCGTTAYCSTCTAVCRQCRSRHCRDCIEVCRTCKKHTCKACRSKEVWRMCAGCGNPVCLGCAVTALCPVCITR